MDGQLLFLSTLNLLRTANRYLIYQIYANQISNKQDSNSKQSNKISKSKNQSPIEKRPNGIKRPKVSLKHEFNFIKQMPPIAERKNNWSWERVPVVFFH